MPYTTIMAPSSPFRHSVSASDIPLTYIIDGQIICNKRRQDHCDNRPKDPSMQTLRCLHACQLSLYSRAVTTIPSLRKLVRELDASVDTVRSVYNSGPCPLCGAS